jgi:hypothetical protein
MVIEVPAGDAMESTRDGAFDDAAYDYVRSVGAPILEQRG